VLELSFSLCVSSDLKQPVEPIENMHILNDISLPLIPVHLLRKPQNCRQSCLTAKSGREAGYGVNLTIFYALSISLRIPWAGMFQAHIQGPFGHVNPQWGHPVLCVARVLIPRMSAFPRGANFSTAVILSAAKDLRSLQERKYRTAAFTAP